MADPVTITRTPMIDDDGTGKTGTVVNNAWKQELYGQIDGALAAVGAATPVLPSMAASTLLGRGAAAGAGAPEPITLGAGLSMAGTVLSASAGAAAWTDVPFASLTFDALGGGTWTVEAADLFAYAYLKLSPDTLMIAFNIQNTVVAGAVTAVRVALPPGFLSDRGLVWFNRCIDQGVDRLGYGFSTNNSNLLSFQPINMNTGAAVNFTAGPNLVLQGTIVVRVKAV